jgi:hypothetical protein
MATIEKFGYVLVAVWGCLLVWFIGDSLGLDKNTWPAWVQAVGSIAAIAAGFLITASQQRKNTVAADDERSLEKIIQLNAIQNIVMAAEVYLANAWEAFSSGNRGIFDNYFQVTYRATDLRELAAIVGQIPLHSLRGEVFGLFGLKPVLLTLDEYLSHFAKGHFTDEDYRNMVERLRKDLSFVRSITKSISAEMVREGRRVSDRSRVVAIFENTGGAPE